ncbi:MAG: DUF3109 family protein [Bacteroidota bacterium]
MARRSYETLLQLDDKFVSADLNTEMFACDISQCKGACCVEGDLGAPLEVEELGVLEEIYEAVAPYLRKEGKRAIEEQGQYVLDITDSFSTPLVNGKECAYVTFSKEGVALCGIEQAYFDGKTDFRKPISCHLYPVRITHLKKGEALNYDRWSICSPACKKGKTEGVKVYEFVKDALIRKYGEAFYEALDMLYQQVPPEED